MTVGANGAYISWNLFREYATKASLILRDIFCVTLDALLGEQKTVRVNLPAQGVTTLMEQKDQNRLVHHLLYASPVKRGNGIEIIEDIIPLYGITCTVRTDRKIKNVYLAPQMQQIPYTQEDGVVTYTVEKLENHQMVVLDY